MKHFLPTCLICRWDSGEFYSNITEIRGNYVVCPTPSLFLSNLSCNIFEHFNSVTLVLSNLFIGLQVLRAEHPRQRSVHRALTNLVVHVIWVNCGDKSEQRWTSLTLITNQALVYINFFFFPFFFFIFFFFSFKTISFVWTPRKCCTYGLYYIWCMSWQTVSQWTVSVKCRSPSEAAALN